MEQLPRNIGYFSYFAQGALGLVSGSYLNLFITNVLGGATLELSLLAFLSNLPVLWKLLFSRTNMPLKSRTLISLGAAVVTVAFMLAVWTLTLPLLLLGVVAFVSSYYIFDAICDGILFSTVKPGDQEGSMKVLAYSAAMQAFAGAMINLLYMFIGPAQIDQKVSWAPFFSACSIFAIPLVVLLIIMLWKVRAGKGLDQKQEAQAPSQSQTDTDNVQKSTSDARGGKWAISNRGVTSLIIMIVLMNLNRLTDYSMEPFLVDSFGAPWYGVYCGILTIAGSIATLIYFTIAGIKEIKGRISRAVKAILITLIVTNSALYFLLAVGSPTLYLVVSLVSGLVGPVAWIVLLTLMYDAGVYGRKNEVFQVLAIVYMAISFLFTTVGPYAVTALTVPVLLLTIAAILLLGLLAVKDINAKKA